MSLRSLIRDLSTEFKSTRRDHDHRGWSEPEHIFAAAGKRQPFFERADHHVGLGRGRESDVRGEFCGGVEVPRCGRNVVAIDVATADVSCVGRYPRRVVCATYFRPGGVTGGCE